MMRHTRKCLFILVLTALSLALAIPVFAQSIWRSSGPRHPDGSGGHDQGRRHDAGRRLHPHRQRL